MRVALLNSEPPDTGVGRYARTIQQRSAHEVTQFSIDKERGTLYRFDESGSGPATVHRQPLSPADLPDSLRTVATLSTIYNLCRFVPSGFDVYHLADQNMANAVALPTIGRTVVTVHDLAYLVLADGYAHRLAARALVRGVRSSDRVVGVSRSTSDEVVDRLGVPPDRVSTIYHGVDERFRPIDDAVIDAFAERHSLDRANTYLLHVGNNNRRQNLPGLLAVLARVNASMGRDVSLLRTRSLDRHAAVAADLGVAESVVDVGRVPEADLPSLYGLADVLVITSVYEGFCFPALEAMACGTPVVGSAVAALSEVVGDAGLLKPPAAVDAFAAAVCEVLSDPHVAETLVARGLERSDQFDWERSVAELDSVYEAAAAGP